MTRHHRRKSFSKNLFLSVGAVFLLFALCFSIYQYKREKDFKLEIMQSHLQAYSYDMMRTLGDDLLASPQRFKDFVMNHNIRGLRATVIAPDGKVLLDSKSEDVASMANHKDRSEIRLAIKHGVGYDVKRNSETLNRDYFYYATYFEEEGFVLRIAIPYNTALTKSLEVDSTYFLFSFVLTILLGYVLYRNTQRIGRHVRYLRRFALKAERGEPIDRELQMQVPDDELGDISHTIIVLYWKLKHSEEDKIRLKKQLTQNVAHELKTPASSIQGYLETIINTPGIAEEKRSHFLERCYAQSVRMSRLLQDMSDLTKLEDSANVMDRVEVNVLVVVKSVLEDTMLQLQEKNLHADVEIHSEMSVQGDNSAIYSIFRNLVDNVISYAAGATRLVIKGHEKGDYCEFMIEDNGIGVEPQHLPHLFERFYRVDKGRSRKLGGTGLGLAIVKNAVTVHGGTIYAENTLGGGLTIFFTLHK